MQLYFRNDNGYNEPTAEGKALLNEIEEHAQGMATLVAKLQSTEGIQSHWIGIADDHIWEGFANLVRSVTKSDFY